jgi:hypothetical protein
MSVVLNFSRFLLYPFESEIVNGVFLVYPYPHTGPPVTFRLEEIGEADFTGYLVQFWTPHMATLMPNLRRVKFPRGLYGEVSVEKYFAILQARGVVLC